MKLGEISQQAQAVLQAADHRASVKESRGVLTPVDAHNLEVLRMAALLVQAVDTLAQTIDAAVVRLERTLAEIAPFVGKGI